MRVVCIPVAPFLSRRREKLRHGAQKDINAGVEPSCAGDNTRQYSAPDENHHIDRNGATGIHTTRIDSAQDRQVGRRVAVRVPDVGSNDGDGRRKT